MQFWTTFRRQDGAQPEKDLMLAVLTDVIWDYKRNLAARQCAFPRSPTMAIRQK